MGNMSTRQRITMLAREKSRKLDLSNHRTGWNALCKLWDGNQWCRERLKMMGYGIKILLNFSRRKWDPENGSKGRMPVLIQEWEQVGIQRSLHTQTPRLSDSSRFSTDLKRSARPLYWNDKTRNNASRYDQNAAPGSCKLNDRWAHKYDLLERTIWVTFAELSRSKKAILFPAFGRQTVV